MSWPLLPNYNISPVLEFHSDIQEGLSISIYGSCDSFHATKTIFSASQGCMVCGAPVQPGTLRIGTYTPNYFKAF